MRFAASAGCRECGNRLPMTIVPADERWREAWLRMRVALWPECPRDESSDEIARILQSDREAAFPAMDSTGAAVGFAEVSTREYADGVQH